MSGLPSIQTLNSQKHSKSISFGLVEDKVKSKKRPVLNEARLLTKDISTTENHGNKMTKDKTTESFEEIICRLDKNEQEKLSKAQNGHVVEPQAYSDKSNAIVYSHTIQCLHESLPSNRNTDGKFKKTEDFNLQLSKMLREKDREISRLREIIRKTSLDRENVTCADANSRMRMAELKQKLSNQRRHVEHVTTVERLRCKEKVQNETERLRHERDDSRAQLAHYEKLVWHLRKQVEQLGYLSRQRYKTIQELNKKMAAKDKSIQEMRKRMEQAQLIAIPGTSAMERRNSISNPEPRNITWETPSRLATVNEIKQNK